MVSRRKILHALGTTAAASLIAPYVSAAPRQASRIQLTRAKVMDADFDVTPYLRILRDAGVKTIGRYYDRPYSSGIGESCYHHPTKVLTRSELAAIENAGMSVITVFQHCNAKCENFDIDNPETAQKGTKDAQAAAALATQLHQPANTPIYFGIDFSPWFSASGCTVPADRLWRSIDAYFDQIAAVFSRTSWQIGVYGAGATCERLKRLNKARYFWLSASLGHLRTREFFNAGQWHLFQNNVEIKKNFSTDTWDTDVTNPTLAYFGQWTTRGRAPTHDVPVSRNILESRAFVKKACVYRSGPDGQMIRDTTLPMFFNTTCRVLSPENAQGHLGVSMTEGDVVEGYVHKNDLVFGGLWGNMPIYNSAMSCGLAPTS